MLATKKNRLPGYKILIHIFFIILSLSFILPFCLIIGISLSHEADLSQFGYRLIPKKIVFTAYQYVFANPKSIRDAYIVTAAQSFIGTALSVLVMSLCAYPLAIKNYKLRGVTTFFIFFTMLFSGGLIPSYILNTQYLHMKDTFWIYIFPGLANGFQIIVFRTFFQDLPPSLIESAKIDGASELRVFFQIIYPLSTPVLATIALFNVLDRWNVWYTTMIYINNQKLYTLQYLLQRILLEAEFIKNLTRDLPVTISQQHTAVGAPTESMKFAMCVVAAGPMLLIFPFFQKYFASGLTVGAVKG